MYDMDRNKFQISNCISIFTLKNLLVKETHVKLKTSLNKQTEFMWRAIFPSLQTDKNLNCKAQNEYIVFKPRSAYFSSHIYHENI
jgi:hypothetical protein